MRIDNTAIGGFPPLAIPRCVAPAGWRRYVRSDVRPDQAENIFRQQVTRSGLVVERLSAKQGVDFMLDFYRAERLRAPELEPGADTLLFQWGTYDWGAGEHFEFDLTRQFIWASSLRRIVFARLLRWELSDVTAMSQLHLTFFANPSDTLRSLGSGDHWCSRPENVSDFREIITSSAAYGAVERLAGTRVELRFEYV